MCGASHASIYLLSVLGIQCWIISFGLHVSAGVAVKLLFILCLCSKIIVGMGCVPVCLCIGIFQFSECLHFSRGYRGRFEATCSNDTHGKRSRLSGTSKPPEGGLLTVPGQGRPLSLLFAWLTVCQRSDCKHPCQHLLYKPDFEYRRKCREQLLQSDNPIILTLSKAERDPFAWEEFELVVSE